MGGWIGGWGLKRRAEQEWKGWGVDGRMDGGWGFALAFVDSVRDMLASHLRPQSVSKSIDRSFDHSNRYIHPL